ncbi:MULTISPECIES: carboxymuconolactone decarboxylase family protein [unclassified Nocardioides]|uniref:carboxymuconolactone decarboxylase family protein n=1 Tax=unclassified Nocardioides TaxID=2615069 RepID=UPI0009EFE45D|nr:MULTISPECIES: carboxymuconolactone decarboxylase family protein [unclassified Nocardioides]GAW47961.1 Alkylhydroperoxidase AhpD family core domain-containing protein [Nocardioides sp. PD653-B2]GAW53736.1 Alkylhydroperoxidase AhpD family core domain-containing protein [Nocardioides sp. PD653]
MALVGFPSRDDIDPSDLPALEAGEKAFGQTLHTWSAILNCPGLFGVYLPFVRTVSGPGSVDQRVKDLTAVRVSVLNHCRYTTSHRCFAAKNGGVTDEELVAVADGDFSGFTEVERVGLELAEAMTIDLPQTPRSVSEQGVNEELLARARASFDDRQLTELLMAISLWNALTRFHRVLEFDFDLPAPPDEVLRSI